MKIVISNRKVPFDLGCRILKTKDADYSRCTIKDPLLADLWDDIKPLTFQDISRIENVEYRRAAYMAYGPERLLKDIKAKPMSTVILDKNNKWLSLDEKTTENHHVKDVYELYEISASALNIDTNTHFVRFKCTSTQREYILWVDLQEVQYVNNGGRYYGKPLTADAIDAIAWTFTVNVKQGHIHSIKRQGDCIMVKLKDGVTVEDATCNSRHLTGKEYKELLVSES